MSYTESQLDAVSEAKKDPRFAGKKAGEIAAALKAEGHAAWSEKKEEKPAKASKLDIDPGPLPGAAPKAEKEEKPAKVEAKPDVKVEKSTAVAVLEPKAGASRDLPTTSSAPARQPLALATDPAEGFELLDRSDFTLSQLAICQAQTRIEGNVEVPAGSIYYREQPHVHATKRKLVILAIGKGRSFMLPFSKDQRPAAAARVREVTGIEVNVEQDGPVCFSRDRTTPTAPEGARTLAKTCLDCSFSRWRNVGGKSVMDCGESYDLLVLDLTDGVDHAMPAMLFLRGSAIKPTKTALTNLFALSAQHRIDGKQAPTFAFELELSTKLVQGDEGKYHVPVWGYPIAIAERERIEQYRATRAGCMATQTEAVPA